MYLLGHVYFWYNRNDYANFMFLLVFVVLTLNVKSLLLHPCRFRKSVRPESTAPVNIIGGLVFLWGRHRYSIYYRIWRRGNWCRILLMICLADAADRDCWLYRSDSCGTKTFHDGTMAWRLQTPSSLLIPFGKNYRSLKRISIAKHWSCKVPVHLRRLQRSSAIFQN